MTFLLSPGIKGTKFRETYRSSLPEEFGALENFAKFAEKHRFSTKVTALQPSTLLKTRLWHRCFPVSFAKFLITTFSTEYPPWLLLYIKLYVLQLSKIVKIEMENCQKLCIIPFKDYAVFLKVSLCSFTLILHFFLTF